MTVLGKLRMVPCVTVVTSSLVLLLLLVVVIGSTTASLTCSCGTSDKTDSVINIICDEVQHDKTVTSCEKAYESRKVDRGYRYIPGHGLYKLYRTAKDWPSAKETCARDGGRLAVPTDLLMVNALVKLADDEPKMVYGFLGISDVPSKGFYVGVDGKLAPFLNWAPGEPNNASGDEHCVLLQKDGFMNDFDCLRASPFFCERRLPAPLPDGYVFVDQEGFFKLHKTKMNFTSAEAACRQEGGHLAVPETQGKAEALVAVVSQDWSNRWVWVGLTDEVDEGKFVSVKGTPMAKLQYDNWAKGEPNNVDGGEDCVTLFINGLLKDSPCGENNHFLCELPVP